MNVAPVEAVSAALQEHAVRAAPQLRDVFKVVVRPVNRCGRPSRQAEASARMALRDDKVSEKAFSGVMPGWTPALDCEAMQAPSCGVTPGRGCAATPAPVLTRTCARS